MPGPPGDLLLGVFPEPLIIGLFYNLLVVITIVRFIYYPSQHEQKYIFMLLAFNISIYFVLGLLSETNSEFSVGAGFGLFAVFSILRYRTEAMPLREATYLFVVIAVAMINSTLASFETSSSVMLANVLVLVILYGLEKGWGFRYQRSQKITYDRIKLIKPRRHDELLSDLEKRCGFAIQRCKVDRVNFSRGTAEVTIYYNEPQQAPARIQLKQKDSLHHDTRDQLPEAIDTADSDDNTDRLQ